MIIFLSPVATPQCIHPFYNPLALIRKGHDLIINDILFEFHKLGAGSTLPNGSVNSPYVLGEVNKTDDGVLNITLLFPHGYDAPHEAKFPEPILVTKDGPVTLPDACWPPKEPEYPEEPQPEPEDDSEER